MGRTALIIASQCGYTDMVGLLLRAGADLDCRDIVSRGSSHPFHLLSKCLIFVLLFKLSLLFACYNRRV